MAWQAASINWPVVAENIQDQAQAVTDNIDAAMQSNLSGLATAAGLATFAKGSLSDSANALLNLRQQLNSLLVIGQVLTVHQYQYGIGLVQKSGTFLSAQNAVNGLITKLSDQADDNRPSQNINTVTLLLTADTQEQFSTVLNSFTQVLPVSELTALARRVEAELAPENKLQKPAVDAVPRFKPNGYLNQQPLRSAIKYQGAQIAQLESLASDQNNVVAKLNALQQKRAAALTEWQTAIDQLKNIVGNVQVFTASGSAVTIASELKSSGVPNAQSVLSAAVMFSSEQSLSFLEGLFNV